MRSEAGISSCKQYRWWLYRCWDDSLPLLIWVMMNPSTADHEKNDPTISKVIKYSQSWGYGGIVVLNLYAIRCTDSSRIGNRVGHRNDWWLRCFMSYAKRKKTRVITAWGVNHLERSEQVRKLAKEKGIELYCLRVSKNGEPCHPLYLKSSLTPVLL